MHGLTATSPSTSLSPLLPPGGTITLGAAPELVRRADLLEFDVVHQALRLQLRALVRRPPGTRRDPLRRCRGDPPLVRLGRRRHPPPPPHGGRRDLPADGGRRTIGRRHPPRHGRRPRVDRAVAPGPGLGTGGPGAGRRHRRGPTGGHPGRGGRGRPRAGLGGRCPPRRRGGRHDPGAARPCRPARLPGRHPRRHPRHRRRRRHQALRLRGPLAPPRLHPGPGRAGVRQAPPHGPPREPVRLGAPLRAGVPPADRRAGPGDRRAPARRGRDRRDQARLPRRIGPGATGPARAQVALVVAA